MKLDSKYFDGIRVKPAEDRRARPREAPCQWSGCANAGTHKAPMGRGREGRYFLFCIDHVREYNHSYNYFDGMNDAQVAAFQKDSVTGHRPTWKMGVNSWGQAADSEGVRLYAEELKSRRNGRFKRGKGRADPFGMFGEDPPVGDAAKSDDRRPLRRLERKALDDLGLPAQADKSQIKTRFKELVKRHHPDRNGGDKSSEDKLREIIQAYNYLKSAGLA